MSDKPQVIVEIETGYELRDRAFELALQAIETMPAIADENNETPDSMIAITMKLANEIYNFLKGQAKNDH